MATKKLTPNQISVITGGVVIALVIGGCVYLQFFMLKKGVGSASATSYPIGVIQKLDTGGVFDRAAAIISNSSVRTIDRTVTPGEIGKQEIGDFNR